MCPKWRKVFFFVKLEDFFALPNIPPKVVQLLTSSFLVAPPHIFPPSDSKGSICSSKRSSWANNSFEWLMSVSFSKHISPRNFSHLMLFSTCFSKSFFATNSLGSTSSSIGSSIDKRTVAKPLVVPKPLFHKKYSKKVNNKRLYWKLHAPSKTCLVAVCINSVNNKCRIYKPEPLIEPVSTWSQRCYNMHLTLL